MNLEAMHPDIPVIPDRGRQRAVEGRARPNGRPLAGRAPGPPDVAVLEITGEQFPNDAVLLRAGDQPRRRVAVALRRESQHRERI